MTRNEQLLTRFDPKVSDFVPVLKMVAKNKDL